MELEEIFAKKMRKARKAKGLSQEALGELCGLTRNYIGMVERGEHGPTLRTVEVISKALKVSHLELL